MDCFVRSFGDCARESDSTTARTGCEWEEAPVCVACGAVITVKHILIECADLLEIRKKYFEERSLYSLFRNVIPEIFFLFLARDWCFTKYEVC